MDKMCTKNGLSQSFQNQGHFALFNKKTKETIFQGHSSLGHLISMTMNLKTFIREWFVLGRSMTQS